MVPGKSLFSGTQLGNSESTAALLILQVNFKYILSTQTLLGHENCFIFPFTGTSKVKHFDGSSFWSVHGGFQWFQEIIFNVLSFFHSQGQTSII